MNNSWRVLWVLLSHPKPVGPWSELIRFFCFEGSQCNNPLGQLYPQARTLHQRLSHHFQNPKSTISCNTSLEESENHDLTRFFSLAPDAPFFGAVLGATAMHHGHESQSSHTSKESNGESSRERLRLISSSTRVLGFFFIFFFILIYVDPIFLTSSSYAHNG